MFYEFVILFKSAATIEMLESKYGKDLDDVAYIWGLSPGIVSSGDCNVCKLS